MSLIYNADALTLLQANAKRHDDITQFKYDKYPRIHHLDDIVEKIYEELAVLDGAVIAGGTLQSVITAGPAYDGNDTVIIKSDDGSGNSGELTIGSKGSFVRSEHISGASGLIAMDGTGTSIDHTKASDTQRSFLTIDVTRAILWHREAGGDVKEFEITDTYMKVTDDDEKGLEYAGAYKDNFTTYSLVDKDYVDTQISSISSSGSKWSLTSGGSNIYRNSNIGIGDFSAAEPSEALDVNGNIKLSGILKAAGTSDGKINLINSYNYTTSTEGNNNYINWFKSDGTTRRGYLGFTDENTFRVNMLEAAGTSQIILDADEVLLNSTSTDLTSTSFKIEGTDGDFSEITNNYILNSRESGADANFVLKTYGITNLGSEIECYKYRGDSSATVAIQNGDLIASTKHKGYDGTNEPDKSLLIETRAAQDFDYDAVLGINQGVYYTIDTRATGYNEPLTERFKIDSDGAIKFNEAYKFPTADGGSNQILQTNGSGQLSWVNAPSGSGGTSLTPILQAGASSTASNGDLVVVNAATHAITLPTPSSGDLVGVYVLTGTVTNIEVKGHNGTATINGANRSSTGYPLYSQYDYYEFFAYNDGSNVVWGIR